ncbi:MAG: methyltransferase domain-containing protein [Myxococcales bacterium]|nr:methyltransferase domain-containing protein [Myxococcales bacterium]
MNEASIWDRLAGRYDLLVRAFDTSYDRVRARIAEDVPAGARVLEVASGTGQFTAALAAARRRVTATDVSPAMVERLEAALASAGLTTVEARVMSAYALDAAEASFDAVFCANALHVMDDPARALAEFGRVLRPGGVLVAPTFLHGTGAARRALSRALSLVSPFVARTRYDLDGLVAAVGEAGFTVIRAERMPGLFPLGYVAARR